MSESELIKRKIAHWVERSADSTEEELEEAQGYLQKILKIQAEIKGYQLVPSGMQTRVGRPNDDFFTRDKVAVLAEARVYLTELQDVERLREEWAERVFRLARSLASDSFVYDWIETDDEGNGRHEYHEEAKERYKAELVKAEATYREISERLREMKDVP